MENFRIRLIAKYKNKYYHFASLNFKKERELIYVFEYFDKRKIFNFHDFETGMEGIQKQVDHVSFHSDGGTHIYYKNIKGKGGRIDRIKLKGNPFSIIENQYAPLLIQSAYFDDSRMNIQKEVDDITDGDFIFEVSSLNKFSIVLFSLGLGINYKKMLVANGFDTVFNASESKLLCEPFLNHSEEDVSRIASGLFKDTNFLIAYTEKTIPIPNALIEYEKEKGREIGSIAPFSVLPSDDKIINRLK